MKQLSLSEMWVYTRAELKVYLGLMNYFEWDLVTMFPLFIQY